jgi:glycosyltransferase involved in cell wall biosynthesis
MTAPRHLLMYIDQSSVASPGESTVYGRDVAVANFLHALRRHGRSSRHSFFHHPDPFDGTSAAGELLASLPMTGGAAMTIEDVAALKNDFDACDFDVWHDADADLAPAARFREQFSNRLYPITATVHVVSYQGLRHGWITWMLLQRLTSADALIATSTACRDALRNAIEQVSEGLGTQLGCDIRMRADIACVPLPVDTERFAPLDRAEARHAAGLPGTAFIILWIGRVSAHDKADLRPLLRAFRRLVDANPHRELLLVIAGSGEEHSLASIRLEAAELGIAERVVLRPVPVDERHLVHAAADVFVSPVDNVQETLGITPIEAMACGVPQVVADWSGYRDTVVDGDTGFRIPTYWCAADGDISRRSGLYDRDDMIDHYRLAQMVAIDSDALVARLQELLTNEPLRARMAEASRARAVRLYSGKAVIRAHEELWSDLQQRAAGLPWGGPYDRGYELPQFTRTFAHYPTEMLTGAEVFTLTKAGERARTGVHDWSRAALPLLALSPDLMRELLERLAAGGQAQGERELAHLLWLFKHDYVRL